MGRRWFIEMYSMPWNPELYNQFKNIRYQPFFDLMDLVADKNLHYCVDVGCGTGEQTSILSQKFGNSFFTGIDSSKEMLLKSGQFVSKRVHFKLLTIEEFAESGLTWDLIFSNASLQWSDNHEQLFAKMTSKINNGGQLAVQMPFQKENILNKILLEIISEETFVGLLKGFRRDSPLLEIDEYAKLMFDGGLKDLNISLKVYPIIAGNEFELYNFISGSALTPYMERLDEKGQELLKSEFIKRIKKHFQNFPAVYSFKRVLLYGVKK